MRSALYEGVVMHRRLRPRRHRLAYRVFSLLVDLDELPELGRRLRLFSHNRFNLLSVHDADHGPGDGGDLRAWIGATLAEAGIEAGIEAGGRVEMLCYPRILGYAFNPLTVYFCRRSDGRLAAILYQVTNTFDERHCYLLPAGPDAAGVVRHACAKRFYVSPFIGMDATYRFRVLAPPGLEQADQDTGRISVVIDEADEAGTLLCASFTGRRRALGDRALLSALARHPLMAVKVIAGIHWEALRLWLKGVPLHPRPRPPSTLVSTVKSP